jgi:hypothetical protein
MEEFFLEYGDIIHIKSKTDSLNDKQFFIQYIDEKHIRIMNKDGTRELQLEEDGSFSDLAIISVKKIYSEPLKGFALQNGLVIGKTIEIRLVQEDFPDIVGIISNLENDRIELTLEVAETNLIVDATHQPIEVGEIIYIDFEYKGLPSYVKNIKIRNIPIVDIEVLASRNTNLIIDATHQPIEPALPEVGNIDILPEIESQHIPDQDDIIEAIREEYNQGERNNIPVGEIKFGEKINVVVRTEKDEKFLSHSIESQVTDIVDTLLSTIPNNERTESVLSEVHLLVERYKQLRTTFSQKDEHGSIICPSTYGENNKPLATLITSGNSKLPKWILPVIAAERKTYSFGTKEDNGEDIMLSIEDECGEQQKYYKKSNIRDLPFVRYINNVNEYSIPYIDNKDLILHTQQINDDLETLLVGAKAVTQEQVGKKHIYTLSENDKMMIQKLTTGSKYTKNETENIKSFVMLRDFMVEYSKINLNNSSIMTRSAMNKNHISFSMGLNMVDKTVDKYEENNFLDNKNKQLCPKDRPRVKHMEEEELKKYRKTSYDEKLINVTKEGHETESKIKKHFENFKERNEIDFLRCNTNYKLDTKLNDDIEKYAKFVYTIIPATSDLIKLSYIDSNQQFTKNYSFIEFVNQFLEPFMIYSKNIHFNGGYHFIRSVIEDKIRQYIVKDKQHTIIVQKQIDKLKNEIVNITNKDAFQEIIDSKVDVFQKNYFGELEVITTTSSTERLSCMFDIDGTDMMSNIIFSKNLNLVIDPSLVEEVIGNVVPIEKPTDCPQKFIAKIYSSFEQLEVDNGVKELYYDAGQDDTPYEILQLYKKHENIDGNFKQFLEKQLIARHSCPESAAADLATTLILGKKPVTLGEYALLNHDDRKIFYKRVAPNKWEIDRSVKYSEFKTNNELFCNINMKCIKNDKTKTCDSIIEKNVYVAEFKTRLDALDIKLKKQNENSIEKLSGFITRNNNLKYIQSHRQNFLSIELAKLVTIDNTPKSPHTQVRDSILSHNNFPEKQEYLILFAGMFTRTHIENEDKHWLYCVKTNTKLIPVFLIELATEFVTSGSEAYKTKLREILSNCGNPDSDGAYYDENSGYFISKMDFATTDEYTTHSIIEEEEDTTVKKFNRNTKVIETVFFAICSNLNILHREREFRDNVIQKTIEMIDNLGTEEQFLNAMKKKTQLNSKFVQSTYDVMVNRNIIYFVSCWIFISIQTAGKSFVKTKTYEECVQSFSGYPYETSPEDESGIKYLSCAIIKLKSSISPWDAIKNTKEEHFKVELKKKIVVLLKDDTVKDLYDKKRKEMKDKEIRDGVITEVATNNISKWVGVLPPIVEINVGVINNIDDGILTDLMMNPHDKDNKIGLVKSKIILYGYAIIESINNVVKSKNLTLDSSYTQNSCCNEGNESDLDYFIKEKPVIMDYINNSKKCEEVLLKLRQLSTPQTFCYVKDTSNRIVGDQFPKHHLSNIIKTYIHYLKFDTNYPVPSIFDNKYSKPTNYDSEMSFEKKIETFGKDNKYNTVTFDNILKTVYSKNMVSAVAITNDDTIYNETDKFNRFIASMIQNVSHEDIIKETALDIMYNISTTSNDVFTNYIQNINRDMIIDIKNAIDDTHNDDKVATEFINKLGNITELSSWNIYTEDNKIHTNTIFNFVKNAIFNVSKLYPSFIINGKRTEQQKKRWGLSSKHLEHLDKFNHENSFVILDEYNDDDKDVFSGDLSELETIIQLSKNITHSQSNSNLLLTYSWLSVFRIFIRSASQLDVGDIYEYDHYNKKIIQILISFLKIETQNKKHLDISLKQVAEKSFQSKQTEKKKFTDLLRGMNSDGRKLMSQMRNIGLGIWREGKIGLVKYDANAYDRNSSQYTGDEDPEIEAEAETEAETNEYQDVDDEEQSGYDNGDGDGNDDNDNDFDN